MKLPVIVCLLLLAASLAGCVTPKDYTAFRRSHPASILVLPPVNQSTDVSATYSVLTTTTRPLSELGYYVIPVAMADHLLKENGLPVADEMHQAPIAKLREVFGADAALYMTVKQYGTKYLVIASQTTVAVEANLVDLRSGEVIWTGRAVAVNGQSGLAAALVQQVMSKLVDQAHGVAALASAQLLVPPGQGVLKGPRHPEYARQ